VTVQTLIIRGAEVIDGTGAPGRPADVVVRDGTIEAVERPGSAGGEGAEVLDATGLVVTPGFIDVHSHADNAPFLDEDDTSKILQGVTTEVVGNCGFSLAPRVTEHAAALEALCARIFPPLPWAWNSFAELLQATDQCGYVTNYAPLAGHHALRAAVLGMAADGPDAAQAAHMGRMLEEAVEAGAFGLSTGLIYPPGVFAETDEIAALASHLPEQLPYVTHMRGEASQLLTSIDEALRVGELSGRPVHISHLKSAGRRNWGRMEAAVERIEAGRSRGLRIRHDVYPYTAGSTMLTAALPPWFQEGGNPAVLRRLEDPHDLDRLGADLEKDDGTWENHILGAGWEGVVIASSSTHASDGRSLAQLAEEQGIEPFEALTDVLRREQLQVSMIVHAMHEDDLVLALQHPDTMIGSDGLPPGVGGKPHPRMYGTFPRVLARYTRDLKVLTLPDAVRKMTSLPAASFGLADRGVISPGKAADLVAFDPARVQDLADYTDSTREPDGIGWVMVNGRVVVDDGRYRGLRAGQRLAPAR
jgi:N-acyl-D-amino-acid deacylase